jgi:hypothetical protein
MGSLSEVLTGLADAHMASRAARAMKKLRKRIAGGLWRLVWVVG